MNGSNFLQHTTCRTCKHTQFTERQVSYGTYTYLIESACTRPIYQVIKTFANYMNRVYPQLVPPRAIPTDFATENDDDAIVVMALCHGECDSSSDTHLELRLRLATG